MIVCCMLFIVAFIPVAMIYINVASVPGMQMSDFADFVIGLIPALVSTGILMLVDTLYEKLGYHSRGKADRSSAHHTFFFTIVTIFIDMIVVGIESQGYVLDASVRGNCKCRCVE
jgi:hypothetical protein